MTDYTELKRLAEAATPGRNFDRLPMAGGGLKYECTGDDGSLVLKVDHKNDEWGFVGDNGQADEEFFLACTPASVLALIAESESARKHWQNESNNVQVLVAEVARLKAENEALRKDQTDWQAECLKRGFEYVRESDDHYVLADVPEMADLLGSMLGVEVRSKENDAYEEANSQLNERIEGLINTIHSQESMRKDAERWRFVRNPTATGSPFAVWSERTNLFLGKFADEAIDAAMANGEQS